MGGRSHTGHEAAADPESRDFIYIVSPGVGSAKAASTMWRGVVARLMLSCGGCPWGPGGWGWDPSFRSADRETTQPGSGAQGAGLSCGSPVLTFIWSAGVCFHPD